MKDIFHCDGNDWLREFPGNSIHGICTDPPYGLIEFSSKELKKLREGKGGIWRIPPEFDGKKRNPLPRFSVLSEEQKDALVIYFKNWTENCYNALVPGGHVLVASNPVLQNYVFQGLLRGGLEARSPILRQYHGFRGGDRPKNAENEFPNVCVSPRGNYEPWLLFRKPIGEKTVAQNLRKWGSGGLRMLGGGKPIPDIISSFKTPRKEKAISDHPSLKPQHFLRIVCRMLLPLGEGLVVDPFMGSGSTIAACNSIGYQCAGCEIDELYFDKLESVISALSELYPNFKGATLEMDKRVPEDENFVLIP